MDIGHTLKAVGVPEELVPAVVSPGPGGPLGSLPRERSLALIAFDIDQVQQTVLASPRPVTIAGASRMLAEWDDAMRNGEHTPGDATVLYAGGGTATILAPIQHADSLRKDLEQRFGRHAHARATTAALPVSAFELANGPSPSTRSPSALKALGFAPAGGGGFGACLANLNLLLRHAKLAARPHPSVHAETSVPRCAECGRRPREQDTLCEACAAHKRRGREVRREEREARSFDELSKNGGRIAFVCIDGAGIGRKLAELKTIEQYRTLSRDLNEAFRLDEETRTKLDPEGRGHQAVLEGGDDLMFVLPARAARANVFDITAELLRRIEEVGRDHAIGAGAGIVVTNNLTASFAFDAARKLCGLAKSVVGEKTGARSAVDFEVILGGFPYSEDPGDTRKQDSKLRQIDHPTRPGLMPGLALTQRPYTLPRFEELIEAAKRVARAPKSQLSALRSALDSDSPAALVSVHYQVARHRELRNALGIDLATASRFLSDWVLRDEPDNVLSTGIADLIEAARVVR
jgi:hypothetical protein